MSTENALDLFARLRLAPFIKEAVQAAVVARPDDTIDFFIKFLTKNRDNLQRGLIGASCKHSEILSPIFTCVLLLKPLITSTPAAGWRTLQMRRC